MKTLRLVALAVLGGAVGHASAAGLPRATPESQGVSSEAVLGFVEAADSSLNSMHSVMIVRHGKVIAEGWWTPYDAATPHALFSLSKSFTSTAVGLAIEEGKLSLDDEVLKAFPDDAPAEPSANVKAMRVRDLLRMSAGHQTEARLSADAKDPWTKTFLAQPVPFKPGTHFLYNTPATYMLSAMVQKATGQTVLDYLRPRLFEPLGIENPSWGTSPQGVSLGGYGLSIKTEDIARFGQLYLQKGNWDGKQLVPKAWVEMATARQTSNGSNPKSDWEQGYGFQFWRCRNGAFRGDGAHGQFCVVMPEQDTVLAVTSGVRDLQAVLNIAWDKLLPAFKADPLPENDSARQALTTKLGRLTVRPVEGGASPGSVAKVSDKTFTFPANDGKLESVTLRGEERGGETTVIARINGAERRIVCGPGAWRKGRFAVGTQPEQPAAATGAWTSDDTFTAKVCLTETPFIYTLRLKFHDDEVTAETEPNVGATRPTTLVGKAG